MGNYNSCKNLSSPIIKNTRSSRVILPGGEIRQLQGIVKAADLMLESPNYFVVNSTSLNIGKRFSPIPADDDLDLGQVYLMLPMKRKKSVATQADMAAVLMAAKFTARRISGGGAAKVEYLKEVGELKVKVDEIEGFPEGEYGYKLGSCRSKKPLLATILEEQSVCIR